MYLQQLKQNELGKQITALCITLYGFYSTYSCTQLQHCVHASVCLSLIGVIMFVHLIFASKLQHYFCLLQLNVYTHFRVGGARRTVLNLKIEHSVSLHLKIGNTQGLVNERSCKIRKTFKVLEERGYRRRKRCVQDW